MDVYQYNALLSHNQGLQKPKSDWQSDDNVQKRIPGHLTVFKGNTFDDHVGNQNVKIFLINLKKLPCKSAILRILLEVLDWKYYAMEIVLN